MIINDLYFHGTRLSPNEADAVLVVYANAVLALTTGTKALQPIPGRYTQIV